MTPDARADAWAALAAAALPTGALVALLKAFGSPESLLGASHARIAAIAGAEAAGRLAAPDPERSRATRAWLDDPSHRLLAWDDEVPGAARPRWDLVVVDDYQEATQALARDFQRAQGKVAHRAGTERQVHRMLRHAIAQCMALGQGEVTHQVPRSVQRSVATHAVYGLGLYASARLWAAIL